MGCISAPPHFTATPQLTAGRDPLLFDAASVATVLACTRFVRLFKFVHKHQSLLPFICKPQRYCRFEIREQSDSTLSCITTSSKFDGACGALAKQIMDLQRQGGAQQSIVRYFSVHHTPVCLAPAETHCHCTPKHLLAHGLAMLRLLGATMPDDIMLVQVHRRGGQTALDVTLLRDKLVDERRVQRRSQLLRFCVIRLAVGSHTCRRCSGLVRRQCEGNSWTHLQSWTLAKFTCYLLVFRKYALLFIAIVVVTTAAVLFIIVFLAVVVLFLFLLLLLLLDLVRVGLLVTPGCTLGPVRIIVLLILLLFPMLQAKESCFARA